METPYGPPSDRIAVGEIAGKRVAFLPRHGKDHRFPPQVINYRANVYAMKSIGVRWLLGPSAAGSLKKDVGPGSMVVCDQIVDRTKARRDTFYEGPRTTHVSFADPYCPTLRPIAVEALRLWRSKRMPPEPWSSSKGPDSQRAPSRSGLRAKVGK